MWSCANMEVTMVSIAGSRVWQGVKPGEAQAFRSLRAVPLVGPSSDDPSYRLFDAETAEKVEVTEVDRSGSVPNVRLRNRLKDRILLIDGQELIGAKQNRILNADVLVPASEEVVIPVSCVEAGRWGYRGRRFSPGGMSPRQMRSRKAHHVHKALRAERGHRSDQGEVWDDVQMYMCALEAPSPTSAMSDVYERMKKDLVEVRDAFELPPETIGVAVYVGERFVGLDLFDRASTFARHWKALLDSYAIDWLASERASRDEPEPGQPSAPLERLIELLAAAEWEGFDAPGEGRDMRWESDEITASALVWGDDAVVHLQAFPRAERSRPAI
jgi:hypothetical protein